MLINIKYMFPWQLLVLFIHYEIILFNDTITYKVVYSFSKVGTPANYDRLIN